MRMRNFKKFTDEQRREIAEFKSALSNVNLYRKVEVLDYAAKGLTNKEISHLTDYSVSRVSDLISEYVANGIAYFCEEHRKGGNRQILSEKQEQGILEKFEDKAAKGQVVSLNDVKEEYDKVRGKEAANSSFYAFLHRMNWRKVMPRGAHPKKATEAEMEASKKLTLR